MDYRRIVRRYGLIKDNIRKSLFFSPAGLGYSKTISGNFMELINEYTDSLSEYKYKAEFYHQKFKKPYLKFIIDTYLRKPKKVRNRNRGIDQFPIINKRVFHLSDSIRILYDTYFRAEKLQLGRQCKHISNFTGRSFKKGRLKCLI